MGCWRWLSDGKVVKGAWTEVHGQFTLLSAMVHRAAVTIAQVQVPAGTNEMTQVKALLEATPVADGEQVVVTIDAAHTQQQTAEYMKGERGFDYVMTVTGHQPNLVQAVFDRCRPLIGNTPDHVVEEYDRGQLRRWETWITDATGIDFPHIEQAACIRRSTFSPTGDWLRKEYAWIATSGTAATMTAADIHTRIREHWGIENKSHYPRDVTWREDAQQIYTGSGPQVLATLRNLALGLFRLNGIKRSKNPPSGSPGTGTELSHYSSPSVASTTHSDLDAALGLTCGQRRSSSRLISAKFRFRRLRPIWLTTPYSGQNQHGEPVGVARFVHRAGLVDRPIPRA
jgi:predicted transposase YbfD/YdcC